MTIRTKRQAWKQRVNSDPRVTDFDRHLTLAVAGIDWREIVFRQTNGEVFLHLQP
jgi:hypothetical protein